MNNAPTQEDIFCEVSYEQFSRILCDMLDTYHEEDNYWRLDTDVNRIYENNALARFVIKGKGTRQLFNERILATYTIYMGFGVFVSHTIKD